MTAPLTEVYAYYESLEFKERSSFLLAWDPMGVKISKHYYSYNSFANQPFSKYSM